MSLSVHLCLPADDCETLSNQSTGIKQPSPTFTAHPSTDAPQRPVPPPAASTGSSVPASGIEHLQTAGGTSTDPGSSVPVSGIDHPGSALESHGDCNPATARRALVVALTPSVTVLFASKGVIPEVYSLHGVTAHGESILGRIRSSCYDVVWMNLPLRQDSTSSARSMSPCYRRIGALFRVAALVGIFAFVAVPRGRRSSDHNLADLRSDNSARAAHHQYCAANVSLVPGDSLPSNASLVLLSVTSPVSFASERTTCKCGTVTHQDDVERSKSRKHNFIHRAAAFAALASYVPEHVVLGRIPPRSHVTRLSEISENKTIHMCFPTEFAERATSREKEMTAADKTPNRKTRMVEAHADDLVGDLSG